MSLLFDDEQISLGWTNYNYYPIKRWQGSQCVEEQDTIAEEVPTVLVYNGISHVVMLATPTNLEDFE